MIAARELMQRYPALRETWPARQALAWREQQRYRREPRQMASWYREAPDLHTRLCVSNLEMPDAPDLCRPASVVVSLFDEDGERVSRRRFRISRNGSLMLEMADVLPAGSAVRSGQLAIDFEGANLGSSRAYVHWYNEHGLTSTHEKYGLTIPGVGGYWTVPSVRHDDTYRVHLAVVNLDAAPYTSSILLKNAGGTGREAEVEVPPNGSRFFAIDDLFADPAAILGEEAGTLTFGNNSQPAIYYYFVANSRLGTWRAQHL